VTVWRQGTTEEECVDEAEDDSEQWHELDQASVRKSIKELLKSLPDDYSPRVAAFKQLDAIMREEMASGLRYVVNALVSHHPRESAAQAQQLVTLINGDLASLHLALKHPLTDRPGRLGLTAPSTDPAHSWVQVESFDDDAKKPYRLRHSMKMTDLELIAAPPQVNHRQRGR
jgi:hypothetical protein